MADIMRSNVQTYVRELISKEFKSKNIEKKVLSDHCKKDTGEHQNGKRRPVCNHPLMKEQLKFEG